MRGPKDFVSAGFEPPSGLVTDLFVLEPLGPGHNERDHAAWTSSIEHIRATPGWVPGDDPDPWPHPMTLEENLGDMDMHARHFRDRVGFTYTVLDPADGDVIGCVYIYPSPSPGADALVKSWVRASKAELDGPLWETVSAWLERDWPFGRVDYASRERSG